MPTNPELTPSKRGRILQQVDENTSYRKIASEQGCSISTVSRTVQRQRDHHTRNSLPRSGRPRKFSDRDIRSIIRQMREDPRKSFSAFARDYDVDVGTIRSIADQHDLHRRVARKKPFLSASTIKKRLDWAKENVKRNWKSVIWTDESSLEIGADPRRIYVTRRPNEAYARRMVTHTFRSNRHTLMVWGAVAYNRKWPLVRVPLAPSTSNGKVRTKAEGLNGEKYTNAILSGPLLTAVNELKASNNRDVLVVEDGAPSHKSATARNFRVENDIINLTHPPSSPDLNLIETLWKSLKVRIASMLPRPTNLDQLWEYAQKAWEEIPMEMINGLVDEMPNRVQSVKTAKGHSTKF